MKAAETDGTELQCYYSGYQVITNKLLLSAVESMFHAGHLQTIAIQGGFLP